MTRVAVIGNAGGGKTTLSIRLGKALGLAVHLVDQAQWKPDWVYASPEEFARHHDAWLATDRWIIDGWGPWDTLKTRFEAADTIIFVDHPLRVHFGWAFKRQVKSIFKPRDDVPEDCPMLPMTWRLIKVMWHIHKNMRPELMALIASFRDHRRVIHIRSPREMRQFLQQYC